MKSITKLSAVLLAAATCAAWPAMGQTDAAPATTNAAPAAAAPAAPRPQRAAQFRGAVTSIDATDMMLTLKNRSGETKVKVTSATKIKKDGQPAQFSDVVEGAGVSGSGKKGDDGVWTASTLNIRTKTAAPAPAPKAPPASGQ